MSSLMSMSFTPSVCMMAFIIGIVLCIFVVLFVFMNKNTCPKDAITTKLVSVEEDAKLNTLLCNFFIKSSYNSCATGNFMNGWVNLCALDRVIQYGCRVLDFEIYTVNGRCVVSTSNSIKLTEKGTYNSLSIGEVLERIRNTAVSRSLSTEKCPNPSDPLFLHFRMKTDIEATYNELARAISSNLGNVLLSPQYNIVNYKDFCKTVKFSDLKNKVIVIVDKSNRAIESGMLGEVTHILGNGDSFHSWSYNDIAFSPDEGITDFNSLGNMTYCYPPLSFTPKNYSSVLAMQYGVQMCGLCYQNNDTHLKTYNALFDTERSAFIIKTKGYYNPQTVRAPALTSGQQLAP
jgi:hypothetical protein